MLMDWLTSSLFILGKKKKKNQQTKHTETAVESACDFSFPQFL